MPYRVKNITIAIALALVAALLTSFYVTNYQRNVREDETNVKVYVASRDIKAGTPGSEIAGMLEQSEIVRRNVVPGAISNPAQVAELVATQPIYAGEQVSTRRFATPAERGVRAQIKGTMRAFQVPGDQHQLLAGTLRAGDRVDVVASFKIDTEQDVHATRIILRDIEVLQGPGSSERRVEARAEHGPLRPARGDGHAGAEALPCDESTETGASSSGRPSRPTTAPRRSRGPVRSCATASARARSTGSREQEPTR